MCLAETECTGVEHFTRRLQRNCQLQDQPIAVSSRPAGTKGSVACYRMTAGAGAAASATSAAAAANATEPPATTVPETTTTTDAPTTPKPATTKEAASTTPKQAANSRALELVSGARGCCRPDDADQKKQYHHAESLDACKNKCAGDRACKAIEYTAFRSLCEVYPVTVQRVKPSTYCECWSQAHVAETGK